jgi:hypothetical protein
MTNPKHISEVLNVVREDIERKRRPATWKAVERQIARRLGGQRVPITGRARGSAPDIAHPWLSVEVKSRRKLPQWLLDALDQARAAANDQQLPIAILHKNGQRFSDAIVMMRLADFEDWFGEVTNDR